MAPEPEPDPRRLRVVQVIPYLGFGGLERVAATLTAGLAPRVGRVVVCSSGGGVFEELIERAGVPLEWIPRPKPASPRRFLRAIPAIARVLRRERPDIVHAHNPAAAIACAIARTLARQRQAAIVTTFHGGSAIPALRMPRAVRTLALTSDIVVGVGPTTTRDLLDSGLREDRVVTVANGVEVVIERSRAEVRDEFGLDRAELVVNVGRYVEQKAQHVLIDAVALLAGDRPHLRALIVGEGDLEHALRERAAARGVDDVVRLTGPRRDAVDLTAAADVFVLSSAWEPLGLVVLEAMAAGVPVVATAAGGVTDLVRHEETGLLVPVGDAEALASAVARLLDDPSLAERLTAAAHVLVRERFSVGAMVEGYLDVYERAIHARRNRYARLRMRANARRARASRSK